MGAVSFGIDRIKQLPDNIFKINGGRVPVVLISDAGVADAGIFDKKFSRQGAERAKDTR